MLHLEVLHFIPEFLKTIAQTDVEEIFKPFLQVQVDSSHLAVVRFVHLLNLPQERLFLTLQVVEVVRKPAA